MISPKIHRAFSIKYSQIVRELFTDIYICHHTDGQIGNLVNLNDHKIYQAIWDTGATNSVISPKVVAEMNLIPTGVATVRGINYENEANTYIVDIGLPNKVLISGLNVSENEIGGGFDVLIGMDIIQQGDFNISNADGRTKFSFCIPYHDNPICLVEKSNKVNERNHKKARHC